MCESERSDGGAALDAIAAMLYVRIGTRASDAATAWGGRLRLLPAASEDPLDAIDDAMMATGTPMDKIRLS
jgi:hypothetical protein